MFITNEAIQKTERYGYEEDRGKYLRLDLNENPGGLPQELIKETLEEVTPEFLSQYPEMADFTQLYADYLGVEEENLCLVNGSAEGIRYIIEGFTSPEGEIVCVSPSYAMYEVYASMYNRTFTPVPYDSNLNISVDKIIDAISFNTQLLILLNPNNPIGNVYSEEEMARIMKCAIDNEVTVLIDEAYHLIYPNTFLHYALENNHVFITRTFSKLCSLAGCRLGAVIGWPQGVRIVQKLCTPHNVNSFALLFAKAIIENRDVLQQLADKQSEGKAFLQAELEARGYDYLQSEGNFMFFKPHCDAVQLVKRMKDEKMILIKAYHGIGRLGTCVRVTTAEQSFMKQFLNALDELDVAK